MYYRGLSCARGYYPLQICSDRLRTIQRAVSPYIRCCQAVSDRESLKYSCTASNGEKEHVYTGKAVIRHIEDGLITCIFEDAAGYRHGGTVTVSFTYKSEQYDSVVPFDVLYEASDSQYTNMYTIYYAVPIPDEPGRYTVVQGSVKVLETNGIYAAIEYRYTDGRKIIRYMDGNVTHGSTVRERN